MTRTRSEQAIRTRIGLSATLALAGLALGVSNAATIGGWMTVGSLIVLVVALHQYGRQGPDPS